MGMKTTMNTMQRRPNVVVHELGYSKMTFPLTLSPKVEYPANPTTINNTDDTIIAILISSVMLFNDLSWLH